MADYRMIPIELLNEPPLPVRASMDEAKMADLMHDIRCKGILVPLIVHKVAGGAGSESAASAGPQEGAASPPATRYEIVDGHRRYIAARGVNLKELPSMVYENLADAKFAMMISVHSTREEVTPAEEGAWFLELAEQHGWSIDQIKQKFDCSENYINDRVLIVQKDGAVCQAVAERKVGFMVAKEILRCDDAEYRRYLLDQASTHGATAKTIRYMLEQWKARAQVAAGSPAPHTPLDSVQQPPPEAPRCIMCGRDDDLGNITTVPVHWYHKRDLTTLLQQLGIYDAGRVKEG